MPRRTDCCHDAGSGYCGLYAIHSEDHQGADTKNVNNSMTIEFLRRHSLLCRCPSMWHALVRRHSAKLQLSAGMKAEA